MSGFISTSAEAKRALKQMADSKKAAFFPRFFKTGPGEYGEGDVFLGVTVPKTRSVAKRCRNLPLADVDQLLMDPIHECRLLALLILVDQYKRGDEQQKKQIFRYYRDHLDRVNNWDLVDSSAAQIVGAHLDAFGGISLLDRFAKKKHLWTQRIAIIATLHFIKHGMFEHTFRIADLLLHHPHDLIHKAVGWMLREVGKRDSQAEKKFLQDRYQSMPRTMLRYAIEKFPENERKKYLSGEV